jgi:phosphoglycolate phosphatase
MAAIIFDFDGTIADSFEYVVDFLVHEGKKQQLDASERQQLRGMSMFAMARRLGNPRWRLLRLLFKGRRRMGKVMDKVEPFDGMPALIQKLHAEGHELFILSSNSVANVHRFLHHHQLHEYFLEVYGGVGLFGKSGALRGLLRDQHIEKPDSFYVGDELRDVQAAQAVDIRVVAVTWGFARPSDLETLKPTALAENPADLMKILEEV